jgi:hypothetical protein
MSRRHSVRSVETIPNHPSAASRMNAIEEHPSNQVRIHAQQVGDAVAELREVIQSDDQPKAT